MPRVERLIFLGKLVVSDPHREIRKVFPVPFRVPSGWQGGTAEQYLASAEKISLGEKGKRRQAANWVLSNREIILDHHMPISRT